MLDKSSTHAAIERILRDANEGKKSISESFFWSDLWNFYVKSFNENVDKLTTKITPSSNTELSSNTKTSANLEMVVIDNSDNSFELIKELEEVMADMFRLLTIFEYKNISFSKALVSYLTFFEKSYIELLKKCQELKIKTQSDPQKIDASLPLYFSGHQLSMMYSYLNQGTEYFSFSSIFHKRKKEEVSSIATAMKIISEARQHDIINAATLAVDEKIRPLVDINIKQKKKHSLVTLDLENITQDKKNNYYSTFKNIVFDLLELQKDYVLEPPFNEAIRKFFQFLVENYWKTQHEIALLITSIRQQELLLEAKKTRAIGNSDNNNVRPLIKKTSNVQISEDEDEEEQSTKLKIKQ